MCNLYKNLGMVAFIAILSLERKKNMKEMPLNRNEREKIIYFYGNENQCRC
jgi:hypothetical protein